MQWRRHHCYRQHSHEYYQISEDSDNLSEYCFLVPLAQSCSILHIAIIWHMSSEGVQRLSDNLRRRGDIFAEEMSRAYFKKTAIENDPKIIKIDERATSMLTNIPSRQADGRIIWFRSSSWGLQLPANTVTIQSWHDESSARPTSLAKKKTQRMQYYFVDVLLRGGTTF